MKWGLAHPMRHLHLSGADTTLCGVQRGMGLLAPIRSVHITKARKTDCQVCRKEFRRKFHERQAQTTQRLGEERVKG